MKRGLEAYRRRRPELLEDLAETDLDQMPSKLSIRAELQALLGRGTRCLFIFTERGMQHSYNHERQIFEAFPELRGHRGLEIAFMRGTDHTFTLLHHQVAVIDVIERWAQAFGAFAPVPVLPLEGRNGALADRRA